jgi:hypothetical protein
MKELSSKEFIVLIISSVFVLNSFNTDAETQAFIELNLNLP